MLHIDLLIFFFIDSFPNDPCVGSGSRNGTCYTSDECSTRGGSAAGTCANGFGVCCTCKQKKNDLTLHFYCLIILSFHFP